MNRSPLTMSIREAILPNLTALEAEREQKYQRIGSKGDLIAMLTTLKQAGSKSARPALCIANKHHQTERRVFVMLDDLWQYLQPDALTKVAPSACEILYGMPTKSDYFRFVDAMYEFAEDLVHAPPPEWITNAEWLAAVRKDGFDVDVQVGRQQ